MTIKTFLKLIGVIIILIVFTVNIVSYISIPTVEKYTGENEYGKFTFERNKNIYQYNFIPCTEIIKKHVAGDAYKLDFYTNGNEEKLNCAINIFTDSIVDTFHSQFESSTVYRKQFTKVIITSKMNKYEIELTKIEN